MIVSSIAPNKIEFDPSLRSVSDDPINGLMSMKERMEGAVSVQNEALDVQAPGPDDGKNNDAFYQKLLETRPDSRETVLDIFKSLEQAPENVVFPSIDKRISALSYCESKLIDDGSEESLALLEVVRQAHIQLFGAKGFYDRMLQSTFFPNEDNGDVDPKNWEW